MKFKTALFDFDGVIVDTEPIYDIFWNEAGERYGTGIDNFAAVIKGTTLPYIMEKYFSDRTEEFRRMVINESTEYESTMPLPAMPGIPGISALIEKERCTDGISYKLGQCEGGTCIQITSPGKYIRHSRDRRPHHKGET